MSTIAATLAAMPDALRRKALVSLSPKDLAAIEYEWAIWGRPEQQLPVGDWFAWVILAGRGWGKTATGSQAIRKLVETGRHSRLLVCGPTTASVRRDLIEGPSGILATAHPDFRPSYEPSTMRLVWPNGAIAHTVTMEEPDRARGVNVSVALLDEFANGANTQATLDMILLGLRINGPTGDTPRLIVTTTPKPVPALRKLVAPEAMESGRVILTRGRTMDNAANLAASALTMLQDRFAGTRLGRQELDGEMLTDTPGALWTNDIIESARVDNAPHLRRIVVAIDPAGGSSKRSDETGIIAAGTGADGHIYILRDQSGRYSPDGWARRATDLYSELRADCIVAEQNFGGEMVQATIQASGSHARIKMVHASRGKAIRAEPIVSLYEQARVHHVGAFPALEDQMTQWSPTESTHSPDRLDALVWACTELSGRKGPIVFTQAQLDEITPLRSEMGPMGRFGFGGFQF